ncbi:MAG TPA: pilus assembly PilX N-terminal domain-containing protein [Pirellulales bacterium]|nr:pilus assembly PilX N-terminal domain-containing protein [Pirellulales bacterium]
MSRKSQARRGAALVMALVAITVLTIIGGALVRLAVVETKTVDVQQRERQARRLAEAGVARAAAQLKADPKYRGETWSLAGANALPGGPAQVTIEVSEISDQPGWRRIAAAADYPSDAPGRARQRQSAEFELNGSGEDR